MVYQISALGRTVSLGDHDTEEEAAHAFDRAAISKGGRAAKTNFPVADYEAEIAELTGKNASISGRKHCAQYVLSDQATHLGVLRFQIIPKCSGLHCAPPAM